MEARSVGGLSGSPVYVHIDGIRSKGVQEHIHYTPRNRTYFYLWGLVSGHWDVSMTPRATAKHRAKAKEKSIATGVSIVIPADRIVEVVNQDYFVDIRKSRKKQVLEETAPTPDSAVPPEVRAKGRRPDALVLKGPWEDRVKDSFGAKPMKRKPKG
jgi:hypothetical protein